MRCGNLLNNSQATSKLLKYVQNNQIDRIENLINQHGSDLLTAELYDNQNILTIACNDQYETNEVTGETIQKLISLGASCSGPTKIDHWEAIHYTALNANKEKMSAVIPHLNSDQLNSLVYCSNHIPIKYPLYSKKNVAKSYSNNALSILLKYGNPNKHLYECCQLLIKAGVDVDQKDSNGLTPRDLIQPENAASVIEILEQNSNNRVYFKTTFEGIKLNNVVKFVSLEITREEANNFDGPQEEFSSCTLLQLCCAKGLTSCVEHLLNKNACPNKTIMKNENCPIMIAIIEDHEEIVKLLLQSHNLILSDDILIKLQIKYNNSRKFDKINKYMEIILNYLHEKDRNKLKKCLLFKDELNRTVLHYASQYGCSETILQLLSMGAPLTEKDLFDHTPLKSIEPAVLEKFFDNCIHIPGGAKNLDNMFNLLRNKKLEFSVEINYESLIIRNNDGKKYEKEDGKKDEEEEIYESKFLHQMIKSKKFCHLVDHPVISSYLALKWNKFKLMVYINLFLYFVAYISLLFYGFGFTILSTPSNSFLLVSLLLLLLREFVQMLIFRFHYVKRLENIIDLFLIGGIIYIIASGWIKTLLNQNLLVAFSVVFLASTLGIFVQLQNIPFFTIKVIILRQIAINFLRYMVFYIFPIVAFFFCFYMLSEDNKYSFFGTLYKIITMFAGDEDSNYPEQFITNPIFSHIIYVTFIVLIGIILQNLLIGLAVSDLQEIQKEATFIDKKERAKYITNIERIIFKKWKQSSSKISTNMFKKLVQSCKVFNQSDRCILVIEPYNAGLVYVKDNPNRKQYLNDKNIINKFQIIVSDFTLKNKETEQTYSLKDLYEKLQRLESLFENFNISPSH